MTNRELELMHRALDLADQAIVQNKLSRCQAVGLIAGTAPESIFEPAEADFWGQLCRLRRDYEDLTDAAVCGVMAFARDSLIDAEYLEA